MKRLKKDDTALLLIDFQERIMPVMDERETLEQSVVKIVKGCRILGVPILVTQQYTKGLGSTIPSIHEALTADIVNVGTSNYEAFDKTTFSALGAPGFAEALKDTGKKTVLVAGIEAHICVQQTVIDLLELGYTVFVAADCVSSRKPVDRRMAKSRQRAEGAVYTTVEAALFELCGGAKEPGFKEISAMIK